MEGAFLFHELPLIYTMTQKPIKIAWFGKHFGEEPPLAGLKTQGAGGIFFSGCNLRCVFCQNYQISQGKVGQKEYSVEQLADMMLDLQKQDAVNIDLVSPTIWFQQIKEAILIAKNKGLVIPIVWNSNAYESEQLLKEMEGLVDIYLPDFKYGDDKVALKYSNAKNYSKVAKKAIKEMLRQVGNLKLEQGIAKKGVVVRHLVLPNNLENSLRALEIIASVDRNVYLSLMNQYYPLHKAKEFPEISRQVSGEEFQRVLECAEKLGFENGWVQQEGSSEIFVPDFMAKEPFK